MNICSADGGPGKSISQIAKECGVRYDDIYSIVYSEGIESKIQGRFKLYDKYQEELIQRILYFTGQSSEITLESKINLSGAEYWRHIGGIIE